MWNIGSINSTILSMLKILSMYQQHCAPLVENRTAGSSIDEMRW
jgi:hypothetical protein